MIRTVSSSPTVDTNIYASGDLIGTKMTFDLAAFRDADGVTLEQVLLVDLAKQSANIDLILFATDPTGTTFTDNAAFDVADADMAKIVAVVPLTTHHVFSDNSISRGTQLAIPLPLVISAATPAVYGALVSRATPTFTAGTDVRVQMTVR